MSKSKSKQILFFLQVEMVLMCVAKTYKSQTVVSPTLSSHSGRQTVHKKKQSDHTFHTMVVKNNTKFSDFYKFCFA